MNENLTKEIIENKNEISALHILLIIILITVDYVSMFNYGIELKSFKFIINYQELFIINVSIIIIFSLLSIITKKTPYLFFTTTVLLLTIIVFTFDEIKGLIDSLINSFGQAFILTLVITITLYGPSRIYTSTVELIETYGKKIIFISLFVTSILITLAISNHYDSLNYNWNKVYVKDDKYFFDKYSTWQTLFKQKIFSTNRLEELQTNITFQNSEMYVTKLKEMNIVTDNILKYDDDTLFSNYLTNDEYKTFFILKKNRSNINEKSEMIIIFTKMLKDKVEYQINNVIVKEITIEYLK